METTTGQGVDDARLEGWLHFMRVMMGGEFCSSNKEKAAYRAFVNGALGEDAVKETEDALTRAIDERLNNNDR